MIDLGFGGTSFGINFFYFTIPRKLILCNKYNAKCLFWLINASHFDIKNQSQNHVFSRHLPAHPFFKFYVDVIGKWSIWGPFKIRWVPKWDPTSSKWRQVSEKFHDCSVGGGFYSWPAFPRTIIITVAFGPSDFLKVIC